ncbi:MAG: aldo/keto reductase [Actinomycetota bacterium]
MRYRAFGPSGIRISDLILGTMMFGDGTDWVGRRTADAAGARAIYDAYRTAGGNTIDTANRYTDGLSEQVVGDLVKAERDAVVLSTKYTLTFDGTDPNAAGNHRKSLRRSVHQSLDRLGTDYIDILWVHVWDALTPIEETMRAIDDLVTRGTVLAVGISDTPAWVVAKANTWAQAASRTPFSAIQVPYSAAARDVERELLPMAASLGLSVAAWSPLSGGLLSGRYADPEAAASLDQEHERRVAMAVAEVAAETGHTSAQVALAWLMSRPGAPHPIIGSTKVEQVVDTLAAADLVLDEGQLARITDAAPVDLGFPGAFIAGTVEFVNGPVASRVVGL